MISTLKRSNSSVIDAGHQVTVPSGKKIEGQPSSPLNVNCLGEGKSFRPGKTISNPHVLISGGKKEQAESAPDI